MNWNGRKVLVSGGVSFIGSHIVDALLERGQVRDIRRLMKDYEMLEIRKEHIFPYDIDKYNNYQYQRVSYFRWLPKFLFRWLERHLGWTRWWLPGQESPKSSFNNQLSGRRIGMGP